MRAAVSGGNRVWAMERNACTALRSSLSQFSPQNLPETPKPIAAAPFGTGGSEPKSFPFVDGVAVLDVQDAILQSNNLLNRIYAIYFGSTITEVLSAQFDAALADNDIQKILLRVNSPGGEAGGLDALSEKIFNARQVKPIIAHVDGWNCSAGYYLSSGASAIYSTKDSTHGCIGTMVSWYNFDKMLEEEGIEEILVVSKVSPDKVPDETTPEGLALYQGWINDLGRSFVDAVARNRGTDSETIIKDYGSGWVKAGRPALAAGMIDGIASFDQVLAAMIDADSTEKIQARLSGGLTQKVKNLMKLPFSFSLGGQTHQGEFEVDGAQAATPNPAPAVQQAVQQPQTLGGLTEAQIQAMQQTLSTNRAKLAASFAEKHGVRAQGENREPFQNALADLHLLAQQHGFEDKLKAVFDLLPTSKLGSVLPTAELEGAATASAPQAPNVQAQVESAGKSVVAAANGNRQGEIDKSLYKNIPNAVAPASA